MHPDIERNVEIFGKGVLSGLAQQELNTEHSNNKIDGKCTWGQMVLTANANRDNKRDTFQNLMKC